MIHLWGDEWGFLSMNENKITQADIIKEVGSICACNSTLAFSQMIDRSILLESPQLDTVKFGDIEQFVSASSTIVVGVHAQILSGIVGQVSLLFKEKSAYEFVSLFSMKPRQSTGFMTEMGVSTIKELGNVVVSAYTGAMSLLLGVSVFPSIPVLSSGPVSEVIKFGFSSLKSHEQVYVHTMTFKDNTRKINGSFFLLLEPNTVRQISQTMRQQLRANETATAAPETAQS